MKTLAGLMLSTLIMEPSALGIINGENAEHPSVVALQMSEIQDERTLHYYKGSGVLIAEDVVLTAAHNIAYIPIAKT